MDLRNKKRASFSGFFTEEVEKMESLLKDRDRQSLEKMDFCKKLAGSFNKSKARKPAGKPHVKWTEVQNWFRAQPPAGESEEDGAEAEADIFRAVREACSKKGKNVPDMEFEAKSYKDSAWYDVDYFVDNKHLDSPDLAVKNDVRERSIPLEASQCHLVKVGQSALHYLKEEDAARYFDVKISGIKKKKHDATYGCSCVFTVQYIRDDRKNTVTLGSLCFRPSIFDSGKK